MMVAAAMEGLPVFQFGGVDFLLEVTEARDGKTGGVDVSFQNRSSTSLALWCALTVMVSFCVLEMVSLSPRSGGRAVGSAKMGSLMKPFDVIAIERCARRERFHGSAEKR